MNTVKIANILEGRNLPEAGMALFPFIEEAINSNQTLCIDMEGVDSIPTLFMNTSFGVALDKFGIQKFKSSISFAHIKKSQVDRIKKYLVDYEKAYLV